jgi:acetyl esterase/lipase
MSQLLESVRRFVRLPLRLAWRVLALRSVGLLIRYTLLPKFGKRGCTQRRIYVPSRTPGRSIPCLAFFPPPSPSCSHSLPVYINLHGGGFVAGAATDNIAWCEQIAQQCQAIVIGIDYRLGPLYLFPAANDDCEDVLSAILSPQPQPPFEDEGGWAMDRQRIAIGGDSAGGALALAVASQPPFRHVIKAALCFYAPIDMMRDAREKPPAAVDSVTGAPKLDRVGQFIGWLLHDLVAAYAHHFRPSITSDPRLSPCLLPPSHLPARVLLVTAGLDVLLTEQRLFMERMQASEEGRQRVVQCVLPHLVHGFLHMDDGMLKSFSKPEALPEKHHAIKVAFNTLKEVWAMEQEE